MINRRKFIKSTAAGAAFVPLLSIPKTSLTEDFKRREVVFTGDWMEVKKMFPMPLDEAYFNTGTLGAQPTIVLEKTVDSMRFNAENIAKTDYQGNGP